MQQEIEFEYIRFHGIFSDDMMIVNFDEEENVTYNLIPLDLWSYVDELSDFFIGRKLILGDGVINRNIRVYNYRETKVKIGI